MFHTAQRFSIRNQIIILCSLIGLVSATLVGTLILIRTNTITVDTATNNIANETRLIALKFQNAYDQLQNDAFIVKNTPPIDGIISSFNTSSDPLATINVHTWKQQLENNFVSIMETRKHYTQMRFIGVANNGQEITRVNRTRDGQLIRVPENLLQAKGNEPYFKKGLGLKEDQIRFSEVSYNKELGEIAASFIPTVRAIVPVFYDNTLFGMLVINANYQLLLENTFKEILPSKSTYVANNQGDYSYFNPEDNSIHFEFHQNYTTQPPEFIKTIQSSTENEAAFSSKDALAYFVRLSIDINNPTAFLGIVTKVPKNIVYKAATSTINDLIYLSIFIIMVTTLIAFFIARKLTTPLKRMTDTLRHINIPNNGNTLSSLNTTKLHSIYLPTHLNNEIGDFAQAFKTMMAKLQSMETRSQNVLENIIDGIITTHADGTIESYNPSAEKMFDIEATTAYTTNISSLIPHLFVKPQNYFSQKNTPLQPAIVLSTNNSNYPLKFETNILDKLLEVEGQRADSTTFALELSLSEARIDDKVFYISVIRDITERKRMEIMKDEFISTVNHELRTPLTSIQGSLGMLKTKVEQSLDAKSARLLELAYNNCVRLTSLVNDILDMEKIAAGKMDYTFEIVNIVEFVHDIIERHQSYADRYKVSFKLINDVDTICCRIDRGRFNQALVNLISNASKFSEPNDTVTISIRLIQPQVLRIAVQDNGAGIPKSFRKHIFSKFAQADSSSTRNKGGTGLGLNITRSIIEAFGGTIGFESIEGEGSTFYFDLPSVDMLSNSSNQGTLSA